MPSPRERRLTKPSGEPAIWLNLEDVYWAKQGRESLDAAAIVATLFVLAGTGAPFWSALWKDRTHRAT